AIDSDSSGLTLTFSAPINPAALNLYDTQTAGLGPADVTVTGAATGAVRGSLLLDPTGTQVIFLKTGGVFANDTYTVRVRSAANGVKAVTGGLLDGNADAVEGDDYVTTFAVNNGPTAVVVGVADFARGPGQAVH